MRFVLVVLFVLASCQSKQIVYKCRACFVDDPSRCGAYEGACYGAYSHSMPARSEDEAKELAAQDACTARYGGVIPPTGPQPGCAIGLSYTDTDRKASITKFTMTCSSYEKKCP